jgi:hypothetical protein
VLQYEVKMEEPLSCGGAYVKLFDAEAAGAAGVVDGEFDNDTPYIIMFGPDRCGATNKVRESWGWIGTELTHRALNTRRMEESRGRRSQPKNPDNTIRHLAWG